MEIMKQENTIVHDITIDSAHGDLHFQLIYGDMMAAASDLLVTTVYEDGEGELFSAVKRKLALEGSVEVRKVLPLLPRGSIGFIDNPEQKILTVHLDKKEGAAIGSEEFKTIIKATFSAIAALTFEGHLFKDISIPVIGKKGLKQGDYEGALKWFIHYAVDFLKYANSTRKIKYFVHLEEDVPFWDQAITRIFLNNGLEAPDLHLFVENSKDRILELVSAFPTIERPRLKQAFVEIEAELKKRAPDYIQLLNNADVITDMIFKDLSKIDGISCPESINRFRLYSRDVFELQREEPVSDWVFTYFLSIRALHDKNYFGSDEASTGEKLHFLLLLQRTIDFYQGFYKQFYKK
jgi:hypothetical protein